MRSPDQPAAGSQEPSSRRWQVAVMLALIALLNYADRAALSAVFPLLRRDLGMTDVALAATGTFFLWSYALASPVFGMLADRVSRSRIVLGSLVAWSLATILTAFARNTTELLAARVLLGVAEAAYLPAALALISGHHPNRTRATAMGIHLAGLDLGPMTGGTLAGYIGERAGWQLSFILLGVAGLAVAVVAHFLVRDPPGEAPSGPSNVKREPFWSGGAELLSRPTYLCMLVSMMLVSIGTWIFYNWLPLYFAETLGVSLAVAGFSGTAPLQIAAVIGVVLNGWISDRLCSRYPERRLLLDAFGYLAAAPFLLVFLGSPTIGLVTAGCFLFALLKSIGSVNQVTIVCELLPDRLRSRGIAFINVGNCFAGGLGIMAAGYFKQPFGLGGVFAGVSVVMLLSASAVLVAYFRFYQNDVRKSREAVSTPT